MSDTGSGLNAIERVAIQILLERALEAAVTEINMALPKLQGLSARFHKLTYKLETKASELDARLAETDCRADSVFDKTHKQLDGYDNHLKDVNQFLDSVEGSNSGLLPPVDP